MNQHQHYVEIKLFKPNFESTSVLRRLRFNSNGTWYLSLDFSDLLKITVFEYDLH